MIYQTCADWREVDVKNASDSQRIIIDSLYSKYQTNGFITEDEALDLMVEHSLPLSGVEQITEQLLTMNVLIRDEPDDLDDPDDSYDRTRTNYDEIFRRSAEIDPGLASLINEVQKIQAPQHREWINLLPQAKAGNEYAYNRLFQMYLRNVIRIALWHHETNGNSLSDAIQDGCIGLMAAIEKYELGKHGLFTTYAPWWIQQVISRNFMDTERTIRLPVHMFETMTKLRRTISQMIQNPDQAPSLEELSVERGISAERVGEILTLTQEPISLDGLEEDMLSDYGVFADEMFESITHSILRKRMDEVLCILTPRERNVLELRFGIPDEEPMTLEEVGQIYNVTRERIRQIEAKALRKLRHPSRAKYLRDFW